MPPRGAQWNLLFPSFHRGNHPSRSESFQHYSLAFAVWLLGFVVKTLNGPHQPFFQFDLWLRPQALLLIFYLSDLFPRFIILSLMFSPPVPLWAGLKTQRTSRLRRDWFVLILEERPRIKTYQALTGERFHPLIPALRHPYRCPAL